LSIAITPSLFAEADIFQTPTVGRGVVGLTPALFAEGDTFYMGAVGGFLAPATYTEADVFFGPSVAIGAAQLVVARYVETDVFYAAQARLFIQPLVQAARFVEEDQFPSCSVVGDIVYDFPIGRGMLADYGLRRARTSGLIIGRH
jgi:hypothetical protein